ncbi:MAG TPA: hypothetical protein VK071_01545 [Tissierellales bacterium]|nr:hypothetical protein [Tissierellales bacterium]
MMNKFLEKLKDLLYDATDYIIMLVVVLVVAGIIGWRLEILFAEDGLDKEPQKSKIVASDKVDKNKEKDDETTKKDKDIEENKDKQDNEKDDKNKGENEKGEDKDLNKDKNNAKDKKDKDKKDKDKKDKVITVSIPEGSVSDEIAEILLNDGLIKDKGDFLKTAENLKLETKLKPGKFEIKADSTYEEILEILSK